VNFPGTPTPGELLDVRISRAHPHHLVGERVSAAVPA
jgi:hypothetical protein